MNFVISESIKSPISKSETLQIIKNTNTPSFIEHSPSKSGDAIPLSISQVSILIIILL
ncbi:MAG: hypothetical protein MJ252_21935 [archaeon]|nr:hypothetical protein [archaeon]